MQHHTNNPTPNMNKKRERTHNWSSLEKKFLFELCRKDMPIFENKRLDAPQTDVKNKAWKMIHQKFTNAFGPFRTCDKLKEQWLRMKAYTRSDILNYNNLVIRFGQEYANTKKPSNLSFEIWEFMQESKKLHISEKLNTMFGNSKVPMALKQNLECKNKNGVSMEGSRTPPQEHFNDDINNRISASSSKNPGVSIRDQIMTSPSEPHENLDGYRHNQKNVTLQFNMNNVSTTLEALNNFRVGAPQPAATTFATLNVPPPAKRHRTSVESESNNSPQLGAIMDMQIKEHCLRMKILEMQLQSATHSRDVVEITKTIALQKLQKYIAARPG